MEDVMAGKILVVDDDAASVGVNRMQHNLETMQCEIDSRKVAEPDGGGLGTQWTIRISSLFFYSMIGSMPSNISPQ
jgi:hypothetical protein